MVKRIKPKTKKKEIYYYRPVLRKFDREYNGFKIVKNVSKELIEILFENEKYKYLSIESKVIYSFLLNRMNLSRINHWINNDGEIDEEDI